MRQLQGCTANQHGAEARAALIARSGASHAVLTSRVIMTVIAPEQAEPVRATLDASACPGPWHKMILRTAKTVSNCCIA